MRIPPSIRILSIAALVALVGCGHPPPSAPMHGGDPLDPYAWEAAPGPAELPDAASLAPDAGAEAGPDDAGADAGPHDPDAAFVCPMHAEVRSDVAGECPQCGMKLRRRNP